MRPEDASVGLESQVPAVGCYCPAEGSRAREDSQEKRILAGDRDGGGSHAVERSGGRLLVRDAGGDDSGLGRGGGFFGALGAQGGRALRRPRVGRNAVPALLLRDGRGSRAGRYLRDRSEVRFVLSCLQWDVSALRVGKRLVVGKMLW